VNFWAFEVSISKGSMSKWPHLAAMAAIAAVLLTTSILRFRKSLG